MLVHKSHSTGPNSSTLTNQDPPSETNLYGIGLESQKYIHISLWLKCFLYALLRGTLSYQSLHNIFKINLLNPPPGPPPLKKC